MIGACQAVAGTLHVHANFWALIPASPAMHGAHIPSLLLTISLPTHSYPHAMDCGAQQRTPIPSQASRCKHHRQHLINPYILLLEMHLPTGAGSMGSAPGHMDSGGFSDAGPSQPVAAAAPGFVNVVDHGFVSRSNEEIQRVRGCHYIHPALCSIELW